MNDTKLEKDVFVHWLQEYHDWVRPTTDGAQEGIFGCGAIEIANAIGREAYVHYAVPLYSNLYVCLVGRSGITRKSTLMDRSRILRDKAFTKDFMLVANSIGSGEGLLEHFCSTVYEGQGKNKREVLKPRPNLRVLLDEPELTNLLKRMRRPGTANISEILLSLFDGRDFSPKTRTRSLIVEKPFFSLLTSTTQESLEQNLIEDDIKTGLIPRFCLLWCTEEEPISFPPAPQLDGMAELASTLQEINQHAREVGGAIELSPESHAIWDSIYKDFTKAERNATDSTSALMARIPTQTMKFALIYAMQAYHTHIDHYDMERAILVGRYLMNHAALITKHLSKHPMGRMEQRICEWLANTPENWLTFRQIHLKVSGRFKATDLKAMLDTMVAGHMIKHAIEDLTGRDLYQSF